MIGELFLLAVGAYLFGSIPSGLIAGRLTRGLDVRAYGSGKTGATNVLRTLGPGAFAAVFIADFAKGLLPVLVAAAWFGSPLAEIVAGLAAQAGHNWSVYLRFQGGRGVSTGVGALFGMSPVVAAVVILVAVIVMAASRMASLASLSGGIVAIPLMIGVVLAGMEQPIYLLYVIPSVLIVIAQHRDNIERLRNGTERRIGESALPQA